MAILHTIKQDSGLIIEDLKMGDGADCMPTSVITVRYHGTLMNGEPFDSTRGKPAAEFPLDKLIRGWREGLPGMKVGGIRRLTVPAALAYGDKQKGSIPPNSDLVFSIELLGVK
ncbi:MAG: FKBP-type peptidyl-prolyl cis-trans isomerase [Phycisphaerales bacterium]|nr:FKBP-type peptidyl-prolyl cis-trans isomerase [Phycisphaerales bacterium]